MLSTDFLNYKQSFKKLVHLLIKKMPGNAESCYDGTDQGFERVRNEGCYREATASDNYIFVQVTSIFFLFLFFRFFLRISRSWFMALYAIIFNNKKNQIVKHEGDYVVQERNDPPQTVSSYQFPFRNQSVSNFNSCNR